mmetsp:Transcript_33119/g.84069  ORF Transcript_33119/g.84069 Transcript_33119/m.84069 type:complete len:672 (-) Transcript_33119:449-2464(-)|eukprot:CAMPEP_0202868678 /NCGR_PEP_ID=MMETSP1391-20130828/11009_1 /ASSEMBLY_ACC=CAM_ASM_000867 /TAXON_ID=1034604 /ORGANISM="Chlamydomonas leiostraca, Strain SAG 11-49" /LENGTH=671 /DNA_ID=CAMNT_0049548875 /DNA_START=136 /DNA_END=2151 /DNA_ORIENTATION=+
MITNLTECGPSRPATSSVPAGGPVFRPAYVDGPPELDGLHDLQELFSRSAKQFASRPCLGWRPIAEDGSAGSYDYLSYAEVADQAAAVHASYEAAGLGPKDRVGVIGPNCPEMMIAMQAMNRMNGVCVPLYETLGDNAVEYIIEHSGLKLVVAQGAKLGVVARALGKGGKDVVTGGVVYWGPAKPADVDAAKAAGVKVTPWADYVAAGRKHAVAARPVLPDDLCTIMYTSGTTGDPKGVMLSHCAILHTIAGVKRFLAQHDFVVGPDDVYLSYLTMAHIFDRVVEEYMLHAGTSIGYWQGDIKRLGDDIASLRPTIFCGVPRVFERIHGGVNEAIAKAGGVKAALFRWAYARKLHYMNQGWRFDEASPISDLLVFNKVKARLGGRVRVILTGGAPIPEHVNEFLRVAMCAPVVQGYGLTETCAASFISDPYDVGQVGTVGPPLPHTELRLEAVPDMGYDPLADPPRGEVCLRGPGLFSGYYRNEALTKEVMDGEGFFHTGDIAELTPHGGLKIIDRKKNLFKLSHGEYIAVERVENVYKMCDLVEQIWVYGNSFESCLVAVVVPKEKALRDACEAASMSDAQAVPFAELLQRPEAQKVVLLGLRATGKAARLKGFEDIKAVTLEEEAFSVDNDLMTPSFKLKRAPLQKRYQAAINAMYAKLKRDTAPASGL